MITVIDYKVSNLFSITKAFEALNEKVFIAKNSKEVEKATKILLPGVGAFPNAMKNLRNLGFVDILTQKALNEKIPILGICLGMQLLGEESLEGGKNKGLGFVPAQVRRLTVNNPNCRIPHVGWNNILSIKNSLLFQDKINDQADFYFVHSYQVVFREPSALLTFCDHGGKFVAAFQKENIFGVQFHPELSHKNGLQVLQNFINIK